MSTLDLSPNILRSRTTIDGGELTLDAAVPGSNITKLSVYESPFVVDDGREPPPEDIVDQPKDLIAFGRRGDAGETFMTKGSLMPVYVFTPLPQKFFLTN